MAGFAIANFGGDNLAVRVFDINVFLRIICNAGTKRSLDFGLAKKNTR